MEQGFVNKTFVRRGLFDSEGYLFCCAAIQEVSEVGYGNKIDPYRKDSTP